MILLFLNSINVFLSIVLKFAIGNPLKKPTLDVEQMSNYRPVSHLSNILKLLNILIKIVWWKSFSRHTDHITAQILQVFKLKFAIIIGAYCQFESWQKTCLPYCLTIDNDKLLTCLSDYNWALYFFYYHLTVVRLKYIR